jgi:hypothetical protein
MCSSTAITTLREQVLKEIAKIPDATLPEVVITPLSYGDVFANDYSVDEWAVKKLIKLSSQ